MRLPAIIVVVSACSAYAQTPQLDHFENHVRPVLVKHCQKCHGSKKAESGLRVDSRDFLIKGGDSETAIVPGKPEESLLWQAVNHDGYEMPPNGKLPDEAIKAIGKWIRDGAVWPDGESVVPALGDQEHIGQLSKDHWAFQPIEKPNLPESDEANDIDKFVVSRLTAEGLSLSPSADKRTLVRRLHHDLTGLPPTDSPGLRNESTGKDKGWLEEVERILASPHFGERWGRHWLDIARYADTRDWYARGDLNYPFAWTYRDYVIRSFNENLPFDDFIRQQIAADHYSESAGDPTRAALGFLTVGSRFRNRRDEQIADYIDVVSRGLMGLTVACARCHDHKYDPVPTADYYALHGIFSSSRIPGTFPLIDDSNVPDDLAKDYEQQKAKHVASFHAFLEGMKAAGLKDIRGRWVDYLEAFHEVNITRKQSLVNSCKERTLKSRAAGAMFARLKDFKQNTEWHSHPFFGPWARLASVKGAFVKTRNAIAKNRSDSLHPAMLALLQDASVKSDAELTRRMAEIIQQSMNEKSHPELAEIRKLALDDSGPFSFEIEDLEGQPETVGAERGKFDRAKAPIGQLDIDHPGAPPRAMVMLDGRSVDSYIHVRGDARRRGDKVPRRFLTFMTAETPDSALNRNFADGSGRRDLAEALVHPENPLTARVVVNWVWRHYFGRGFILSNDFGLRTEVPAHRDLLDYLSARLIEEGWNLRWLHRQILSSKTYRQNCHASAETLQKDPENNLFGRQTRRRLSYEAMRDSMLTVSGKLDRSMFGRPVAPQVDSKVEHKRRAQSVGSGDETTRRSIYRKIDRVDFDATRATFDFPRPDAAATERLETTVPQQLLFALNSPFVISCAKAITESPAFAELPTDDQRIEWLFSTVLQREPKQIERRVIQDFLPAAKVKPAIEVWQWGFGSGNPSDNDARFQPLPHFTGDSYQIGPEFPDKKLGHVRLTRTGGHPGRNLATSTIIRWTSPTDAEIRIQGQLKHPAKQGDGVRARTIHNDKVIGKWAVFQKTNTTPVTRHRVKPGDTIDFVVDHGPGGSNSDSYSWNQIVTVIRSFSKDDGYPKGFQWNAREAFGKTSEPPLDKWALAAQSLLVSNEFFFVD